MEKQVNQLAAIENLAALSDEDTCESIAMGCLTDTPPPQGRTADSLHLSIERATEIIAAGCVIDGQTIRR